MTGALPRVALLGVYHETNTFSPVPTTLADFAERWYVGERILEEFTGTRTMAGGFIDGAREAGLELVPVFATFATPSGPIERDAYDAIVAELSRGLATAGGVDGVLFELHGDLVVKGERDAEESLVAHVRDLLPGRPIATALDLHANMSRPRFRDVEILTGYRTNPHVDTYERGRDAALLLAPILRGEPAPYRAHRGLPVVAAPSAQRTDDEPLRSILRRAEELQTALGLLDVTVHAGYAYADTDHTGMGFHASSRPGAAADAERAVDELLALATNRVAEFHRNLPEAGDAVARALGGTAPVAIADTGDNINGGSTGDTTWLVHAALAHPERRVLGTIADTAALSELHQAGVGMHIRLRLGGRASERSGPPIDAEVEIVQLTDGIFRNVGPMATGALVSMGGAAWVRFANIDLVVQGRPRQPNDPNLFGSMGIDPAQYDIILLKGAAALRAGWDPIVTGFVDAGTPGETDSKVERLRYRLARPVLP